MVSSVRRTPPWPLVVHDAVQFAGPRSRKSWRRCKSECFRRACRTDRARRGAVSSRRPARRGARGGRSTRRRRRIVAAAPTNAWREVRGGGRALGDFLISHPASLGRCLRGAELVELLRWRMASTSRRGTADLRNRNGRKESGTGDRGPVQSGTVEWDPAKVGNRGTTNRRRDRPSSSHRRGNGSQRELAKRIIYEKQGPIAEDSRLKLARGKANAQDQEAGRGGRLPRS